MQTKLLSTALLGLAIFISGCDRSEHSEEVIKIGTIAGPETTLMEVARDVAKEKYDLPIQIVEFTDYVMPNAALHEGSIDANAYQHLPYLLAAEEANGYEFVILAKTFIYPMGIYSNKITNLDQLTDDAIIAIPNDPSNGARALLLLERAQLIELQPTENFNITIHTITENPKNLKFRELEAAQLPRSLNDVDIAIINTNYAVPAGLNPAEDAIYLEDSESPYANLIVIRNGTENSKDFENLVAAYQSDEVVQKAQELFSGQALPAWD